MKTIRAEYFLGRCGVKRGLTCRGCARLRRAAKRGAAKRGASRRLRSLAKRVTREAGR